MYALVNTMSRTSDSPGRIISRHRTLEAARNADSKLQRMTKAGNGQQSYIPTAIYLVLRGELVRLTDEE